MSKYAIHFVLLFAAVIFQVSLLPNWPEPTRWLHLVLLLSIFVTVVVSYNMGVLWALVGGFLLDLYATLPFGLTMMSLLLTIILVNMCFTNFFTNRSFYSLLSLGALGTVINAALLFGSSALLRWFEWASPQGYNFTASSLRFVFWQLVFNVGILVILFFIFQLFTNRLRSDLHIIDKV